MHCFVDNSFSGVLRLAFRENNQVTVKGDGEVALCFAVVGVAAPWLRGALRNLCGAVSAGFPRVIKDKLNTQN